MEEANSTAGDVAADFVRRAICLAVTIGLGADDARIAIDVAVVDIPIERQGTAAPGTAAIASGVTIRGAAPIVAIDADRAGRAAGLAADALAGGAADASRTDAVATGRTLLLGDAGPGLALQAFSTTGSAVRLVEAGATLAALAETAVATRPAATTIGAANPVAAGGNAFGRG